MFYATKLTNAIITTSTESVLHSSSKLSHNKIIYPAVTGGYWGTSPP